MFLGYPGSNKIVRHDVAKGPVRSIVVNAACGNNSALAKAVLKDTNLKEQILMGIINEIKREIRVYAKDPECLLKQKTPADITKFSTEEFYKQLFSKSPNLVMIIASVSQPGNLKGRLPFLAEVDNRFRNSVCMAAAICLRQNNQQLSCAHYRVSLMLLNGGAKALTLERCAHLGITMSHSSAIKMQNKAAAPANTLKATTWKEDTLMKSLQVNLLEEALKKQPAEMVIFDKGEVEKYDYFEGIYDKCCALLQKAGAGNISHTYPREFLVQAVEEKKRSNVHYK